jgi:hypothetical protein
MSQDDWSDIDLNAINGLHDSNASSDKYVDDVSVSISPMSPAIRRYDFYEIEEVSENIEQMSAPLSNSDTAFPEVISSIPDILTLVKFRSIDTMAKQYIEQSIKLHTEMCSSVSDDSVTMRHCGSLWSIISATSTQTKAIFEIIEALKGSMSLELHKMLVADVTSIFEKIKMFKCVHPFMVWPFILRMINMCIAVYQKRTTYSDSFWDYHINLLPDVPRQLFEELKTLSRENSVTVEKINEAKSVSRPFTQEILLLISLSENSIPGTFRMYHQCRMDILNAFDTFISNIANIYEPVLLGTKLRRSEYTALKAISDPDVYMQYTQSNIRRAMNRYNRFRPKRQYVKRTKL